MRAPEGFTPKFELATLRQVVMVVHGITDRIVDISPCHGYTYCHLDLRCAYSAHTQLTA